jgi:pimeloyl-ACP methyl ester carboxylesterase
MTFPTFDALSAHLVTLFQSQQYAEALEVANRETPNFPGDRPWGDYWRMCAAARVGDRPLLYQIAEQALADGLWYGETLWRRTPSFQPLQGQPEFERLVAASHEREVQESPPGDPVLLTRLPDNHSAASPLLVALHGNQGSAEATLPFWQAAVAQDWAVALAQSSQAMYRGAFVWDDLERARADVLAHFERLPGQLAYDANRVVLAGHSLGGLVAIRLALQGEVKVRGFVANGPATPFLEAPDELEALLGPARERGLRGYFILGSQDNAINADEIHTLAAKLRAAGLACKLEVVYGPAHAYAPAYDPALKRALAFVDAG